MNDPYQILGLSSEAGANEIRQRYLDLVRQNPPERCPERFTEIRAAYEQLKDPVNRVSQQLFVSTRDSMAVIIADAEQRIGVPRIDVNLLLSLGED